MVLSFQFNRRNRDLDYISTFKIPHYSDRINFEHSSKMCNPSTQWSHSNERNILLQNIKLQSMNQSYCDFSPPDFWYNLPFRQLTVQLDNRYCCVSLLNQIYLYLSMHALYYRVKGCGTPSSCGRFISDADITLGNPRQIP